MYWRWFIAGIVLSVAGMNAGQKKAEDEKTLEARRFREGLRKAKPAPMPHAQPPSKREQDANSQDRGGKRETAPPSKGKKPSPSSEGPKK